MRERLRSQAGFTLLEVLAAAIIMVVAFTVLATIVVGGENQASGDVAQAQLINIADQQIEQTRAAAADGNFAALALSQAPTPVTQPTTVLGSFTSPDAFVEGASSTGCGATVSTGAPDATGLSFEIANNYDFLSSQTNAPYGTVPGSFVPWSSCGSGHGEPLLVFPTGTASGAIVQVQTSGTPPSCFGQTIYSPCQTTVGGNSYEVYTFVTATYLGCATGSGTGLSLACPTLTGGQVQTSSCTFPTGPSASTPCTDARRVTVAVVPVSSGTLSPTTQRPVGRVVPLYLSTILANPSPVTTQQGTLGLTLGLGV